MMLGDSITARGASARAILYQRLARAGVRTDFVGRRPPRCHVEGGGNAIEDGNASDAFTVLAQRATLFSCSGATAPSPSPQSAAAFASGAFDSDHEGHPGWATHHILHGRRRFYADQLEQLQAWLSREPGVPFISLAEERSTGRLSEWLDAVPRPDVVVLQAGINDIIYFGTHAEYRQNLVGIVETLRARSPGVRIIAYTITPLADDGSYLDTIYNSRFMEWNAHLADVVSRLGDDVALVDVARGFNATVMASGLHPTEEGYAHIGRTLAEATLALLAGNYSSPSMEELAFAALAVGEGACTEPEDTMGHTCSHFLSVGVSCDELLGAGYACCACGTAPFGVTAGEPPPPVPAHELPPAKPAPGPPAPANSQPASDPKLLLPPQSTDAVSSATRGGQRDVAAALVAMTVAFPLIRDFL